MTCFNVGNTPKPINTASTRYQGIVAGNWKMPRGGGVTNIYVQNYYNGNYRNWSGDAWANIGEQEEKEGFWSKVGNFLGDFTQGLGVASSAVGIIGDLFGLGKK